MTLTITNYFKNKQVHDNTTWVITAGKGKLVAIYKGQTYSKREFDDIFPIHADTIVASPHRQSNSAQNPDGTKRWMN